jgi:uncharacterized protein (TIGR03435 family)
MFTRFPAVLALACATFAQTPAFEVASVKRSEPITPALVQSGRLHIGVSIDSLHVRISQFSLYELTTLAYQVKGHQISGPDWMVTERYDIQAKLPEGSRRGQVPAMMQTLLAERFGMRLHRENRELNVYALVVANGGPHLKPSSAEDVQAAEGPIQGGTTVGAGGAAISSGAAGDSRISPGQDGNLHIENKKMTLARFADFIGRYSELPVVDLTGLKGSYEMEFDVSGEEVRNAARAHGFAVPPPVAADGEAASDPAGVSLASSLRRLGLKLESRKAPAEVLVIDKVDKVPTAN